MPGAQILGLASGVVLLREYDARWPGLYASEAARLTTAVAPLVVRFERMGSTAVPGLVAKPIVDILGGIESGVDRAAVIAAIIAAGYVHRGENGIPGREFFRRGEPRSYHLHLTTLDGAFWGDHLAFRAWLRAHDDARDAYAALKRELATRYPRDREAYIKAKGPFVFEALARARAATL